MLIGSRALKMYLPDFRVRPDADWDIIGYKESEKTYRRQHNIPDEDHVEIHPFTELNNGKVWNFLGDALGVATLETLYVLYRSHAWRDRKAEATLIKLHKYIIPNMGVISKTGQKLLTERIDLTKKAYGRGNPNLNQSNMDFFDDVVDKVYDHDFLHELYAYNNQPMYELLKYPEKESLAWCEKDLWDKLTYDQQIKCVCEETYVIATERFMVPNNWKYSLPVAFNKALLKVCTTLTSGWFRDFAIDNYITILDNFDRDKMLVVKEYLSNNDNKIVFYKGE